MVGAISSMIDRANLRSPGELQRVSSSVAGYQEFVSRPGTSLLTFSMIGWRVRANPKGPRGDSTNTIDGMITKVEEGWGAVAKLYQVNKLGIRDLTSLNICLQSMELKAFEKSRRRVHL